MKLTRLTLLICTLLVATASLVKAASTGYTYVNSNNGAALAYDDRWLQGIRCWAMSQHAQAGHNYWYCKHTSQYDLYCYHNPRPTSGAQDITLRACNDTTARCNMYISYTDRAAGDQGYGYVGVMSWSPNTPNEIRAYDFLDGGWGSCSAATGNGVFQYWDP